MRRDYRLGQNERFCADFLARLVIRLLDIPLYLVEIYCLEMDENGLLGI